MRKIYFLFVSVALFGMVASSCSKDKDAEPTFVVTDLIGTYEVVGGTGFKECPSGDNKLYEITATTVKEGQTDDSGCSVSDSYAILEYTYINGNTFDCGLGQYKVTNFSGGKLTLVITTPLAPGTSSTINLEKK